jgi:hypothetical protein
MPPKTGISTKLLKNYWVHVDHPELKRLGLSTTSQEDRDSAAHKGRKWIISFEYVNKIEHDSEFLFNETNDSLEIKEES